MDKLQLTGQNLGQIYNFRFDHLHAEHFWCYQVKLHNSNSKTRPKQLKGSLPLVIALPSFLHKNELISGRPYTNAAAMAKLYASETATFVAHQSIQVQG